MSNRTQRYRRLFCKWQVSVSLTLVLVFSWTNHSLASDRTKVENDADIRQGLLSGQYVILLRHALAPGLGDPAHFQLSDCSTQRNLSKEGRGQASKIGAYLSSLGFSRANVFSSQWCRCLETASLLGLGEVTPLPIINSFFQHNERKSLQTQQLKDWLIKMKPQKNADSVFPIILVSHQVNITALTGVFPSSGELVVISIDENGKVSVKVRLETLN